MAEKDCRKKKVAEFQQSLKQKVAEIFKNECHLKEIFAK